MLTSTLRWVDDRVGTSGFARKALDKVFPDHWSFMLGEVAMYCLLVLVATGTYLTLFFSPSARKVTYQGRYAPLRGVTMSEAYASTVRLSFDVRAGLLVRQVHHWAALLFVAAIVAHLMRVFFTGAFRKPREITWLVGVGLLVLAIFNGFSGYSLPDDLLSGTGLRILDAVALAIPLVGSWASFLVFGGEAPTEAITSRLYIAHVLLVPGVIFGLLALHLALVWHQKHTQFPGPGRTEDAVVGSRLWPTYAARSLGLFAGVAGGLVLAGGLAQINPIWLYGPYDPAAVSTAAQPDWYMGWLEGAFRLMPPARLHVLGFEVSEVFWPGVVLPGITFGLLFAWPFLERRWTGDRADHHLLDRPSEHPLRTCIGTGALAFYVVLFVAGSQDLISQHLGLGLAAVRDALRAGLLVVPLVVAALTALACRDLRGREALEQRKAEIRGNEPPPPTPTTDEAAGQPSRLTAVVRAALAALGGVLLVLGRRLRAKGDVRS